MNRRSFIRSLAAIGSSICLSTISGCSTAQKSKSGVLSKSLTKSYQRYAIAMWDYSWLLRHHKYGEFEDWDTVLDQLAPRGYNAVRIDCFPQFIASDFNGQLQDEYRHPKENWNPSLWGNQFTVHSKPRAALLEFLPKCRERGIAVGLSTWFKGHGTDRNMDFQGEADFIRAWDETLSLIDQNGLLDTVLYVDLLNEYPNWHGFDWLKTELKNRTNEEEYLKSHPDIQIPELYKPSESPRNPLQRFFLDSFLNHVIDALKAKYPDLTFFASFDLGMPLSDPDLTHFGAIDYHLWCVNSPALKESVFSAFFNEENDIDFESGYLDMMKVWNERKPEIFDWMNTKMAEVAKVAQKAGIPYGNTEGWGPIFWMDHPALEWDWVKEAGTKCVEMAIEHGYSFICTSNFTHPQFSGIWNDINWHQHTTKMIRY